MNIFFFGGSFDPPHKAHKLIYKNCINLCDKFIFIPSSQTPGKNKPKTAGDLRVRMLNSIIDKEDKNKVIIDDFELQSNINPSHTINTIYYLQDKYKDSTLSMIIGRDQYDNFDKWHEYKKITKLVNIICYNRNNAKLIKNSRIEFVDFDIEISSSEVREKITEGNLGSIKNFLVKDTIDIIRSNKLYK